MIRRRIILQKRFVKLKENSYILDWSVRIALHWNYCLSFHSINTPYYDLHLKDKVLTWGFQYEKNRSTTLKVRIYDTIQMLHFLTLICLFTNFYLITTPHTESAVKLLCNLPTYSDVATTSVTEVFREDCGLKSRREDWNILMKCVFSWCMCKYSLLLLCGENLEISIETPFFAPWCSVVMHVLNVNYLCQRTYLLYYISFISGVLELLCYLLATDKLVWLLLSNK